MTNAEDSGTVTMWDVGPMLPHSSPKRTGSVHAQIHLWARLTSGKSPRLMMQFQRHIGRFGEFSKKGEMIFCCYAVIVQTTIPAYSRHHVRNEETAAPNSAEESGNPTYHGAQHRGR